MRVKLETNERTKMKAKRWAFFALFTLGFILSSTPAQAIGIKWVPAIIPPFWPGMLPIIGKLPVLC